MKLISLNTWGGRVGKEAVLGFFSRHQDADIFCLQEIWQGGEEQARTLHGVAAAEKIMFNLFQDISDTLPVHRAYFRPHRENYYGLALFVKNPLSVLEEGEVYVHKNKDFVSERAGHHARNIQYAHLSTEYGPRTITNFHGLWNGGGKADSEDRLVQSDRIIRFLETISHPFVLCGDFNLWPETESIKKFELFGLRNLIREYGITSTRTSFYPKENSPYADYAFVSPSITVKDFKVLPDEVSDHAPLFLEFE
jgi:endonuclease/exonuclease/phosphatase family metal-dependent hydrolase